MKFKMQWIIYDLLTKKQIETTEPLIARPSIVRIYAQVDLPGAVHIAPRLIQHHHTAPESTHALQTTNASRGKNTVSD